MTSTRHTEFTPFARDEVCRACVLGHIQRVLVAHIDDGRADFDAAGFGADGRQKGKRRRELTGEVVDSKISTVGA